MIEDLAKTPHVAVIIPCFNHAYVLRRTLEALVAQTHPASEIVLVDDGSVDHPESVIQEFVQRLPIQLVKFDQNRGAPAARNVGAAMTHAPYLLFLDADAELVPTALQTFVETLEAHPECDFAYSNLHWGFVEFRAKPFSRETLNRQNFIHTSSLIRRSAFPGFDESLRKFQDWDLWLTMVERGSRGVWIDAYLYRIEPRRKGGMSNWLPKVLYRIPWPIFGWMPGEIRRYREGERIIRMKHQLAQAVVI